MPFFLVPPRELLSECCTHRQKTPLSTRSSIRVAVIMALRPGITEPDFKPLGRLKIPAPIKFFVRFIQAAVTGGGPGPWRQLQHRPTNPVWKEMAWKSTCMHCMHHSYSINLITSIQSGIKTFFWCHHASSCYILLHPHR